MEQLWWTAEAIAERLGVKLERVLKAIEMLDLKEDPLPTFSCQIEGVWHHSRRAIEQMELELTLVGALPVRNEEAFEAALLEAVTGEAWHCGRQPSPRAHRSPRISSGVGSVGRFTSISRRRRIS